jgi:hypothetical protein
MDLFFSEFLRTLAAFGLLALLLVAAGAGIARLFRFPGFAEAAGFERLGLALLCALAVLPVTLDFAGRVSPLALPAVAALIGALGLPELARGALWPKSGRGLALLGAALWIFVAIATVIDWPDGGGGLLHSLTVLDYIKHSEATWAIAQTGTPPVNPTFYAPERASYYYFFYTLTAAAAEIGRPLIGIEPRHAAYAAAPLAGFILFALAHLLLSRARCVEALGGASPARVSGALIAALLLTSGPDILFMARNRLLEGDWPLYPEGWSQQVTNWFDSAVWVPHHVAGLAAAFMGFLALARPAAPDWRRVLFAGFAFASTAGLSVYLATGAALTAVIGGVALVIARRYADLARLLAAGALSVVLAAPWLLSIAGRVSEDHKAPIAFAIRNGEAVAFSTGSPTLDVLVKLAVMLGIYGANFGVFGLGALAFWRRAGRAGLANDAAALLAFAAAAAFLIGSFFESVILQNDLGWRIMLFAQSAALVWTCAALQAGVFSLRTPAAGALYALGCASVLYGAAQLRLVPWDMQPTARGRAADLDERRAWEWVNANTPADAVVLARPDRHQAYDYGLYAQRRAALADIHVGQLFGVSESTAKARAAELKPVFTDPSMTPEAVDALAARYHVQAIVVNGLDPVFSAPGAWTQLRAPAFAAPLARVYLREPAR